MRVYIHTCIRARNTTGECAILKYGGTAFFAGARSGIQEPGTIFLLGIPAFDIVSYVTAMTLFSCATRVTYVQHAHCWAAAVISKLRQYAPPHDSAVIYSISVVTQRPCNSSSYARACIKFIRSFVINCFFTFAIGSVNVSFRIAYIRAIHVRFARERKAFYIRWIAFLRFKSRNSS